MAKKIVTITLDEEKVKKGQAVANYLGISFSSYLSVLIAEDKRTSEVETVSTITPKKEN